MGFGMNWAGNRFICCACPIQKRGFRARHMAAVTGMLRWAPPFWFVQRQGKLEAAGIDYTLSQSGRAALFTRDPDANALEIIEIAACRDA